MKGQIMKFDFNKGFGFINCEDGSNVFVHRSEMKNNIFNVEFEVVEDKKGTKAVNVRRSSEKEKKEK